MVSSGPAQTHGVQKEPGKNSASFDLLLYLSRDSKYHFPFPSLLPSLLPHSSHPSPSPSSEIIPLSFLFLQTKKYKAPAIRTAMASRKPSRRGSTLSLTRTSGGSSPQSSMMSVNPGSDEPMGSKDIEDNESSSTKPEEEILHLCKSY